MDTIFAEATPPGRGGVSIVRLSGPDAFAIAADLGAFVEDHRAVLSTVRDGDDVIDQAVVLGFPAGRSFTGDAVVEFQLHGAPVVVRRLNAALAARGARQAGPGEFTRRAFVAGRIDLTEVQGLSDLLQAETEAQRLLAMRNASGELGRAALAWREKLIHAAAMVMASLDFPDEDVPGNIPDETLGLVAEVRADIVRIVAGHAKAAAVRAGFTVAVIGPPNAGKSSFVNAVAGRDVAIVTEIPGTTRDALEVRCELGGLSVILIDTAGLRETEDTVERIGVDRARARAWEADLRLHLSTEGSAVDDLWRDGDIAVATMADLHGQAGISVRTGAGVDPLLARVEAVLSERVAGAGLVSHEAQADQLQRAAESLSFAATLPAELVAERLREATIALEGLLGRVDMEEYLDVVFSAFCIGK